MRSRVIRPPDDIALERRICLLRRWEETLATAPRRLPNVTLTLLWSTIALLILTYLRWFVLSAAARIPHQVEFMYGESIVLAAARRLAHGESLYPPPDRLPLLANQYTPLYYVVVAGLLRLFGDGYTPGRILSLSATLAAASLLVWCVRHTGGHWSAGLLAAGLFLTQNMTALLWAPLYRVDPLALFLTICGLTLLTVGRPWAAIAPLLLAFMTKQTYLVAPVAAFLVLWPQRRLALGFAGLFAGGVVLAVCVAQLLTEGWFLWYTVRANINPFDVDSLANMLAPFLQFNGIPLLAAAAHFSVQPSPGERLWRFYFVGTLLMLPTIGRLGASSNYWLELTAANSVLIGLLACHVMGRPTRRAALTSTSLAMMLIGALLVAIPGYRALSRDVGVETPLQGSLSARIQLELAPLIATESGDILTDDPALAVAAGKTVEFDFMTFGLLAGQGAWDERPILEAIASRRFGLVVLSSPLETQPELTNVSTAVNSALRAAYEPSAQWDSYWLYRPRGTASGE